MLIKPPCSNEQTEPKKKEPKKVEVDFEKYPRPEGSLPGTLAYERPDLLEEWDYEKNTELGLDPLKLKYKSNKPAQWKCKKCGYEWKTQIYNRANNSNCPACAGSVVTTTNNLAYKFPSLVEEWDYDKNNITPDKVTVYSHKKVWWKCSTCGYEWRTQIDSRTNLNSNCPACANQVVTPTNNLAYKFPNLIEEWDYERNDTTPDKVIAGSHKEVWWKCKTCNHEWQTPIYSRTGNSKSGCPECTKSNQTSFPEQALYFYIHKYFEDAINTYKDLGFELDIYIPSKNTAIEYDGLIWHLNRQLNDQEKVDKCVQTSIKFIRVRELGLPDINNCIVVNIKSGSNYEDLSTCIEYILREYLDIEQPEVHISQDLSLINSQVKDRTVNNSLATLYPEIAEEFMSEKNGITPDKVAAHANDKYWWKCKTCGHEWYALISNRTNKTRKRGCPICNKSNHLITKDRSLAKLYPELLSEYSNENVISFDKIAAKSAREVYWTCNSCNNSYSLRVDFRTASGMGCKCGAGRHPEFTKQRRYIDEQDNLVIEHK